jgi:hypothetical protein
MYDAWKIEGAAQAGWVFPLAALGVGVNTYEKKKKKPPKHAPTADHAPTAPRP